MNVIDRIQNELNDSTQSPTEMVCRIQTHIDEHRAPSQTNMESPAQPPRKPRSVAQAKKQLHDWLDDNRPWAKPQTVDGVYGLMQEIVAAAALAFAGERPVTAAELEARESDLLRFTANLETHPKHYDGPCACHECSAS